MNIESEKIIPPPPPEPTIKLTLTLSLEEASLLKAVVGRIYGDGKGARDITSKIYYALCNLGVEAKLDIVEANMVLYD